MAEFKVGDAVRLRSGGPKMTIREELESFEELEPGETVTWRCQWFAGSKLQSGDFATGALERVKDEEEK